MKDVFILIGEKRVEVDTSFNWMVRYENTFHKDPLQDLERMGSAELDELVTIMSQLLFILTKCELPSEYMRTEDILEIFPLADRLIKESIQTKPRKTTGPKGEPMTVLQVLASGIRRGLTLSDTKELTFGTWLDFIHESNRLMGISKSETVREATQADIDNL